MLRVEGVRKRYGSTEALAGVSMTARRGDVVGLLGPNGAGKTTLVRVLATLVRPDAGHASIGGHDVVRDAPAVRSLIGLAGQAAAIDELLTGRENLVLVARLYGVDGREAQRRATEVVERFDLGHVADQLVRTYSGGTRRRLDLAATLVGRPALLLLDEPTAGLDPGSRNELWASIDEIAADGATVVLTSQYLDEVERLATHVVVLDEGRVIAAGTTDELKRTFRGDVVEAVVADRAALAVAEETFATIGGHVDVDRAALRISVPAADGIRTLIAAGTRLERRGLDVLDLAVRRPSLGEVFFALTSGDGAPVAPPRVSPVDTAPAVEPVPTSRGRGRFLGDAAALTARYLRRMRRTPQLMFFATVQPVLFVVGLDVVFAGLVTAFVGGDYMNYLLPGVLVMSGLLTAGMTGAGLAEDVQAGIVERFRSLPMARSAVLVGRTASDMVRTTGAFAVMIAAAMVMGFRIHAGVAGAVAALAVALLFTYAATWLFAAVGLAVKNAQAAQFAAFAPVLPLVYLSSAWIPVEAMDPTVQTFARNQPVNVAVTAVRALANGQPAGDAVWQAVAWSIAITIVFGAIAVRKYQTALS